MPESTKQQICRMTIMFPVDNDEKAIEYKKSITGILSEIPDARIDFTLLTIPVTKLKADSGLGK
jgi:hypothetical protein